MKGLRYHFKYLLYEVESPRFTRKEAMRLASDEGEKDIMLLDLSSRGEKYRKKVLRNLKVHEDILPSFIKNVEHLIHVDPPSKGSGRTVFKDVRIFQGGAPGLGKRA